MQTYSFHLLFLSFLCVSLQWRRAQPRRHIFLSSSLSFRGANHYCRQHHIRLSSILTPADLHEIKNLEDQNLNKRSWIGLIRGKQSWRWNSGKRPAFYNWSRDDQHCGAIENYGLWVDRPCNLQLPYLCQTDQGRYITIKKRKTWHYALQDCKDEGLKLATFMSPNTKLDPWPTEPHWIALKGKSGVWYWDTEGINGSTMDLNFTSWKTSPSRLCGLMKPDGGWSAEVCNKPTWFVCEDKLYRLVKEMKTWSEAKHSCELNGAHLAEVRNAEQNAWLRRQIPEPASFWIGLSNQPWRWTNGYSAEVLSWDVGEPDIYNEKKSCVSTFMGRWTNMDCSIKLPFFCLTQYNSPKLETVPSSWENAMLNCRAVGGDLASVGDHLIYTHPEEMALARTANSTFVWIGLRFLMGEWLWVNGEPMQHHDWASMDVCPLHHCGSLNQVTGNWSPTKCEEELPFLCRL